MAAELNIVDGEGNTVLLTGEIDTHTSPLLENHLRELEDSSVVVLDLSAVSFISSAGLTAMLTAQARLDAGGGSLTVRNPTAAVERMISLSGLNDLLGADQGESS